MAHCKEIITFPTIIDSILDVSIRKISTTCGLRSKRKGHTAPARTRIVNIGCDQRHSSRFLLEVVWIGGNDRRVISLDKEWTVTRSTKPPHCLSMVSDTEEITVTLVAQSESECQRWVSALMEIFACNSSTRRSRRSLCLSNYFFSVTDSEQAEQCGLDQLEYWAVLERNHGLILLPAIDGRDETRAVTLPLHTIVSVQLARVENPVDVGKVLEIVMRRDSCKVERQCEKMSRRWKRKSSKDRSKLTPTAALGYHTLSLFCPDAQNFVNEWRSCHNLNDVAKTPSELNGNRLSSDSNSSQSTSSHTSQSNLSALNTFLRRSLPSLNNPKSVSSSSPPTTMNQPPPLPSRKELEQAESDRLFERQVHRHWRKIDQNGTYVSPAKDDDYHNQYKLLPPEPIPVFKTTPPPLPPKHETKKKHHLPPVTSPSNKNDPCAHYKILPSPGEPIRAFSPLPLPPPLPPKPANHDPVSPAGYKTLSSLGAIDRNLDSECKRRIEYRNGYRVPTTFYDFLPDPLPMLPQKRSDEIVMRRSLETEV